MSHTHVQDPLHHEHAVVCFYHSNINVSLLNADICTHIVYTSIGTDSDGNVTFPFVDEVQALSELNFLEKTRKLNAKLKVMLSVGDKGEGQRRAFNGMLASSQSRKAFARNIVGFCKRVNLDGIDLSWQRPHAQHSKGFSDLIKRLHERLTTGSFAQDTKMPPAYDLFRFGQDVEPQVLSVTLNASACNNYDLKTINKRTKFVNLMNFDMHAPADEYFDVDHTVIGWVQRGGHVGKLNLGLATYGGSNSTRMMEEKAGYARYGGLNGVAIHAFDGDDHTRGFPLIRAANEVFERHK